jgi:nicotinamide mononucleotide transporter
MNTLVAATDAPQNFFEQILNAYIPIGQYQLFWLELIGVSIGVASAWLGMKRLVWAWPVGITANIMLFFVYVGGALGLEDQRIPLFGQSGRQVFFIIVSIYGWIRWAQHRRAMGAASDAPAIVPRWMRQHERIVLVVGWLVGTVIVHQAFVALWEASPNPFFTPQWWFYWCDAWIFVGSIVATYAMARGWNEFWLAWIAVDLVGVPLGFATGYVPTAIMYTFYGMFVLYGFTQWVKVTRAESATPAEGVEQPAPVA